MYTVIHKNTDFSFAILLSLRLLITKTQTTILKNRGINFHKFRLTERIFRADVFAPLCGRMHGVTGALLGNVYRGASILTQRSPVHLCSMPTIRQRN